MRTSVPRHRQHPADGKADSAAETKNLEKQLAVARRNREKIEKRLSQPGYADAVPEAAKAKDQEKVGLTPFISSNLLIPRK